MIIGTIAAAVSGYLAIAGLLALVRRRSYDVFVVYRVLVGITVLLLIATGVRATFYRALPARRKEKARDPGQGVRSRAARERTSRWPRSLVASARPLVKIPRSGL